MGDAHKIHFGPLFNSVSEDCASLEKIDNPAESEFDPQKETNYPFDARSDNQRLL